MASRTGGVVLNGAAPDRDHGRLGPTAGRVPGGIPRLFVATPVPRDVAARVGDVVERVATDLGEAGRRVRWVQMDGLHVTLRFLGPTDPALVPTVAAAVDAAATTVRAFAVRLGGAGGFPELQHPRALWLGIREGAGELGQLSDALSASLSTRGFSIDPRPFRPHLTIARTDGVRAGPAAAAGLVAAAAGLDLAFTVPELVLYRSHLGHGPARYEALHRAPLGTGIEQ